MEAPPIKMKGSADKGHNPSIKFIDVGQSWITIKFHYRTDTAIKGHLHLTTTTACWSNRRHCDSVSIPPGTRQMEYYCDLDTCVEEVVLHCVFQPHFYCEMLHLFSDGNASLMQSKTAQQHCFSCLLTNAVSHVLFRWDWLINVVCSRYLLLHTPFTVIKPQHNIATHNCIIKQG